jgi:hypothetical protein
MEMKAKGRPTFRIAAVCFFASAVFEILDVSAPVPVLGGIRSGVAAMGYHLIYAALFSATGLGLWSGKRWGYAVFMAGTAVYSLDKAQMLIARQTFSDYILLQFTTPITREILSLVPIEQILQLLAVAYAVIVLCGWGFALYVHLRRSYFA